MILGCRSQTSQTKEYAMHIHELLSLEHIIFEVHTVLEDMLYGGTMTLNSHCKRN